MRPHSGAETDDARDHEHRSRAEPSDSEQDPSDEKADDAGDSPDFLETRKLHACLLLSPVMSYR